MRPPPSGKRSHGNNGDVSRGSWTIWASGRMLKHPVAAPSASSRPPASPRNTVARTRTPRVRGKRKTRDRVRVGPSVEERVRVGIGRERAPNRHPDRGAGRLGPERFGRASGHVVRSGGLTGAWAVDRVRGRGDAGGHARHEPSVHVIVHRMPPRSVRSRARAPVKESTRPTDFTRRGDEVSRAGRPDRSRTARAPGPRSRPVPSGASPSPACSAGTAVPEPVPRAPGRSGRRPAGIPAFG